MSRRSNRNSKRNSGKSVQMILYAACFLLIVSGWVYSCFANHNQTEVLSDSLSADKSVDYEKVLTPGLTDSQILSYPGFTVSFNSSHHQPNYVSWELTGEETRGTEPRYNNFAQDPDVSACASLSDYRGSGFDRGHMAPAGDMKWSPEAMEACFLLTNICPQDGSLNSGSWKKLEEKCRQWAVRDSALVIVCGPILSDKLTRSIGDGVSVPERFFKVILAPYANPPRAIGFIMPNGKVEGGMQQAAVSVDEVEAATGFDFFSELPDEIENQIESQCNFPLWSKTR